MKHKFNPTVETQARERADPTRLNQQSLHLDTNELREEVEAINMASFKNSQSEASLKNIESEIAPIEDKENQQTKSRKDLRPSSDVINAINMAKPFKAINSEAPSPKHQRPMSMRYENIKQHFVNNSKTSRPSDGMCITENERKKLISGVGSQSETNIQR